jgi:P4 family phage/plasmid primase-like protien
MVENGKTYTNLEHFIKDHIIPKDDPKELTHTELGRTTRRRIHISHDSYSTFMKLYYQDVLKKETIHNLVERQPIQKNQQDASIMCIDMDLQYLESCNERQYLKSHIEDVITIQLNLISDTFELDEDVPFIVAVLEKPSPRKVTKPNGTALTKDGVHLMFCIRVDPVYHAYFRHKLIETVSIMECWQNMPIINKNGFDDVFDSAISNGSNGWLPPNSQKPDDSAPYKITSAYMVNYDNDRRAWNQVCLVENPDQLPAFYAQHYKSLFVRNMDLPKLSLEKESVTPFIEKFRDQYMKPVSSAAGTANPTSPNGANINTRLSGEGDEDYQISINTIRQIQNKEQLDALLAMFLDNLPTTHYKLKEAYDFAMSLPSSYYESGSYSKWIKVGFALRNTNIYLLIVWVAFSAQSSSFDYNHDIMSICDFWMKFIHHPQDGVTHLSLMYWSKTDAPDAYAKIHEQTVDFLIEQSIMHLTIEQLTARGKAKCNSTDYDIATVVHHLKKGMHISCGIKTNLWYYFNGVYWIKDDSGTILRGSLSTEVRRLYMDKARKLGEKAFQIKTPEGDVDTENEEHIVLKARANLLSNIATRLGNCHDKDSIMRECRELFYDKDFEQKLDQNRYLLCFKNGVVDFKEKRFRKSLPEDYLSKCTQTDYRKLDEKVDAPVCEEIHDYFRKLFPIPELCQYMWNHLAAVIIGDTAKTQCLHYYTGEGQNGKSMLITLLELILGDYATQLDVSFFVNERPSRGKATPELVSLIGSRLAVTSEPSEGERLNEGPMKQLTSGTDKITYRGLFKDQESFIPQVHSVIMSNHYLPVKSRDHGTWRRIRVVKFVSLFTDKPVHDDPEKPYQFKREDGFDEKFKTWVQVFMAMLVEIAYVNQGALPICKIISDYSKEYQKGQDFITEFIEEKIMKGGPNDRIKKTQISSLFTSWYQEMYSTKISGKTQELFSAIEKYFKVTYKDGYRGICIKRDVQEIPDETYENSEDGDYTSTASTITNPT